jgi:hypothetical protein
MGRAGSLTLHATLKSENRIRNGFATQKNGKCTVRLLCMQCNILHAASMTQWTRYLKVEYLRGHEAEFKKTYALESEVQGGDTIPLNSSRSLRFIYVYKTIKMFWPSLC